jgi:thioredoxin-related protein
VFNLALFVDDKMKLMRSLKVRGLPTSFLVNREGRIVGKLAGFFEWDTPKAEALITHYIN